jgi:hypothetical protein
MSAPQFDIYFHGQIMEGRDPATVKEEIAKLFKADAQKTERLFSGKPICIKPGVDQETAARYRNAIRKAGALVEIRPAAQSLSPPQQVEEPQREPEPEAPATSPAPTAQAPQVEDGDMVLLPPNTGSLIDCAAEVEAQPIPDTSSVSLAPEGATMDESEAVPPLEVDTSDLSLNPPQSGSLEDCARPVEPTPIPDISAMELEEQEPGQKKESGKAVFAIDE